MTTREQKKARIAAALCVTFEAGRAQRDMESWPDVPEDERAMTEREALGNPSDADWLDEYAAEHEDAGEHDWPLWLEHAEHLLQLVEAGEP